MAGPAARPLPVEALACGYRPRGSPPPALSCTEVGCGSSGVRLHRFVGFRRQVGSYRGFARRIPLSPLRRNDPVCVGADSVGEPSPRLRRMRPCAPGKRAVPATKRHAARLTCSFTVRKSRRVPPSRPVAAGEGSDWKRPAGGRSWMTGRFRGGRDSRLENPQSEPDPVRRTIGKRTRSGPSLAGRRRRGREGGTRRLFPTTHHAATKPNAMAKPSPDRSTQQKKARQPASLFVSPHP